MCVCVCVNTRVYTCICTRVYTCSLYPDNIVKLSNDFINTNISIQQMRSHYRIKPGNDFLDLRRCFRTISVSYKIDDSITNIVTSCSLNRLLPFLVPVAISNVKSTMRASTTCCTIYLCIHIYIHTYIYVYVRVNPHLFPLVILSFYLS